MSEEQEKEANMVRLCRSLKRIAIVAIPTSFALMFLIPFSVNSVLWNNTRAPDDSVDCLTNMHDYASIDKIFDEIILEPRVILFWTPFYGGHDYGFGLGSNPFYDHKCKISNCLTTTNKSTIDEADAVVFHVIDLLKTKPLHLPKKRKPHQKYVFFYMEPPTRISPEVVEALPNFRNYFNLTMTYMTSSSIHNPFSKYVKKNTPSHKVMKEIKENIAKKKKMVAWYAHCDEDPIGKAYVDELQKYITVYTYGPCGKLQCGDINSATCWDIFEKEFFFFISIESAMCLDYVTERTYRPLQFNIIPIVYAFGNFSRSMPDNSFINMQGFPNPKNLADFMISLAKNPGALMWYMGWKQHWKIAGWGQGFCELCELLNSPKKTTFQADLSKDLTKDKCGKDSMRNFEQVWNRG